MANQNTTNPANENYFLTRIWNHFRKYLKCVDKKRNEVPGHFLLTKAGKSLIDRKGLEKHCYSFIKDYYNTILEIHWHWAFLIFLASHSFTFIAFGVIWWINTNLHNFNTRDSNSTSCVSGLETFTDCLSFSIETQTTIGYGFAYPSIDCVSTIPTIFFQVLIGFILEAITLGFVFAKLTRPKNRSHTVLFSRKACICFENGRKVLQVQVADLRYTHLIDANVGGMLVTEHVTLEGFVHPLYQIKVDFVINNVGNKVFLMWPLILNHYITDASPLFGLNREDLFDKKIELLVWINGVIESTGERCQIKTSYIAEEIAWGQRFTQAHQFDNKNGRWYVDFTRFEELVPCSLHSSRDLTGGKLVSCPSFSSDISAEEMVHYSLSSNGVFINSATQPRSLSSKLYPMEKEVEQTVADIH